jgi:hypothetical protein
MNGSFEIRCGFPMFEKVSMFLVDENIGMKKNN